MTRFQSCHRCEPRGPLRLASVTRTSQLKRTVNASVYRIHQAEDGKRVKKRRPAPRSPYPPGEAKGGGARARARARHSVSPLERPR